MPYSTRVVTIPQPVTQFYDVRCDSCDKTLEPGFPPAEDGGWLSLQPLEGLVLTLSGSYPSQWDTFLATCVLCDACTDRLGDLFPGINRAMQEWKSREY